MRRAPCSFIARWPDAVKAGVETDFHGSLLDLMATVADMNQLKLSDNAGEDSVTYNTAGSIAKRRRRSRDYHSDVPLLPMVGGNWIL